MVKRLGIQFVLILSVLMAILPTARGQLSTAAKPIDLIYRQIKVNEADIDEILEGTVPLQRNKFEEMVNAVNRLSRQNTESSPDFRQGGYIRQAMYYGRIQGGQIIDGRAVLSIDGESQGGVIPLVPLSIALDTPQWVVKTNDDAPATSIEAISGVTERALPILRLNGSGELIFNWSLNGESVIESERKFVFEVPQSESNYLILDLPNEFILRASNGIVWSPERNEVPLPVEGMPELLEEHVRWVVQLGTRSRTSLTLLSKETEGSNSNVLFYSQELQYSMARDGLQLSSRLTLDSVLAQRQAVTIELSPELELVQISTEGRELAPIRLSPDVNQWSVILEPQGGAVQLDVVAVGKFLPLQPQILPLMNVVDGIWRQGQMTLQIVEDLELYRLDVQGALESRIESASDAKRRIFEMFGPNPHVLVVAGHQEAELYASQISRFEFVANRLDLQTEIRLTTAVESLHQLHLEIQPDWELKSVTLAGSEVSSRRFLPRVNLIERNGVVLHEIELQEGVEAGRVVSLRLNLSRPLGNQRASGELLNVINFPSISESPLQQKKVILQQHLIGLTTQQPNVLQVSRSGNTQINRLNPASEQVSAEPLLRDVGTVFDSTSSLTGLQVESVLAAQSFVAELKTSLTVTDLVAEETRIQVRPTGTPVRQVVVYSSGLSASAVQWRLEVDDTELVQSEEIASVQVTEDGGWQRWQIDLVESRVTSFNLIGTRTFELEQLTRLPLYRVEDAKSFAGAVEIGWHGNVDVEISREPSMERVLPDSPGLPTTVYRQAFQYGIPVGTPPQVSITPNTELQEHVIWNAHMHSKYLAQGFSSHELRYVVEKFGQQNLDVDLPPEVEVESVWVDAQRIHLTSIRNSDNLSHLKIPLAAGDRFSRVRIRFKTSSDALGFRTELQKPLPKVNARILQAYWSVAVPPGYELGAQKGQYSVATRLFGPWLKAESDSRRRHYDLSDRVDVSNRQATEITSLLERAASVGLGSGQQSGLTWAVWLRNVQYLLSEELRDLELVVDVVALDALGIDPMTQLSSEVNEATGAASMQWLRHAELAFVRDENYLTLSSDRWIDQDALSTGRVVIVDDNIRPVFTTYQLAGGSIVKLEDWVLGRRVLSMLSELEVRQLHEMLRQDLMWTYESGVKKADARISLVVYNHSSLVSAAWASLLVWVGFLLWFSRRFWKMSFLAPGVTATFAMFIDEAFVEFGAQAFVASLSVGVCTVANRLRARLIIQKADPEMDFDLQARPGLATSILVLALVFSGTIDSIAYQQPEGSDQERSQQESVEQRTPSVHSVFLPVDDEGADVGEYLYVADEFYQNLRKWYATTDKKTENWLITQAQYQVNWNSNPQDENDVTPVLNIVFEINLGLGVSQISLPFNVQECAIQSVVIASENAEYQWQDDGKAIVLEVSQQGTVTAEIELTPVVQASNDVKRFELSIPGVPESTLESSPVSDEHKILFSGVQGRTRVDALSGRLVAALGSTRQIGVVWGIGAVEIAGASVLESEEYYWLKIAPHSVVLDVWIKVDVVAGTTQQFSMNVDPRLRLLPIRPGQLLSGAPRIRDGELKTLYFSLQRPVSDSFEVRLSFYLEDVSGIGNVPVPEVVPVVQRRRERWLALSVDRDLTWHSPLDAASKEIQQAIALQWGTQEEVQAAYALTDTNFGLNEPITTLPRVVKTEVVQSTDVIVDFDELLLLYRADLSIEDGIAFQQFYRVPQGLIVDSATVHQDGVVLNASVQHSSEGYLTVFTDDGVTGDLTLELRGRVPLLRQQGNGQRRVIQIPTITNEAGIVIDDQIKVIQRTGTLIEIRGKEPPELEEGDYLESLGGRLVAVFESSLAARKCQLQIRRNVPRYRGAAGGGFVQRDGNRTFDLTADLQVINGAVDQIQLQIETIQFQQVRELTGNFVVKTIQSGPDSYLLNLRSKEVVSDRTTFHLSFELEDTDGILKLPGFDFISNRLGNVQQFFYAPLKIDEQQVEWEAFGAQRITEWSTDVIPGVVGTEDYAVFLGTSDTEVRSKAFFQSSSKLEIGVANYELAVIDAQHIIGVATFHVLPVRGQDIDLVWPERWKLTKASVQGTPVIAEFRAIQASAVEQQLRVTIPLLSDRQYQQVDVVFTLESDKVISGGRSLLMLPVPESEVTISTIEILASDVDYKSLEFDSDNIQSGTLASVFAHQINWGRTAVERQAAANFEVNERLNDEQEYWQQYQDRLTFLKGLVEGTSVESGIAGISRAGFGYRDYQLLQAPGIRLTGQSAGALPQVLIRSQLHSSSELIWWKLGMILGVVVLSGCIYLLTERGWLANWVSHAPMSPLVLLGVLWWTFLAPQAIGIVLILMALVGLVLPDRRFIKVRFHWVNELPKSPPTRT